jgi:uncharacterized membrane protein
MSAPTDPADPLAALAAELGRLGRRLDGIGTELLALRAGILAAPPHEAPGALPPQAPGALPLQTPGTPPQQWAPAPWAPPPGARVPPGGPAPGTGPAPYPPGRPVPAGPPPAPRLRLSALSGARLLAWTGGAVTLLGVVLLLVLAASRGWFSPGARVAAGAALGLALIALALRLHPRETARTGALALAGTGFATLYLVVAGATLVLDLAAVPAVLLALLVAAGGLGLADRWRSELLAGGVVVGAVLLAPVLAEGLLLVALALALQVAAVPAVLRRRWAVLAMLAAAGPVLFGVAVAVASASGADENEMVVAVLAVLLAGLAAAALATRRLPADTVAWLVAAAPLPVLVGAGQLGGWSGAAVAASAVLALVALAALPGAPQVVRVVAIAAGAVALFEATLLALDGSGEAAVLLGQATVLAVVAAVLRNRLPLAVAAGYGLCGVLAALVSAAPLAALVRFPSPPYLRGGVASVSALVTGAGVSALVLALAIALVVAGGRLDLVRPDVHTARLWVPVGAVGLYGAAGLVVTCALLVSPDRAGFTAGHALVTVSWTVVALVLLARGISRPALRITGLVLVGAAVAKLVLFDLVALDGLARVAAFLGAGLALLAAGTRYARLVAEAEAARSTAEGAAADRRGQVEIHEGRP